MTTPRPLPDAAASAAADFAVVRKSTPHDSALRHVTGTARYVDDIPEPEGTLHVAPGYCREAARGRFTAMDLSAVRAFPGVVAVLTAEDVPGENDCSPAHTHDEPIFTAGDIRFLGQPAFAVVARTRLAARKAARLAKFTVEPVTPAITVDEGIARGEEVLPPYQFVRGTPDETVKAAPHSVAGTIYIGGQEHFYLEGQVSLAIPGEAGEMYIHTSSQHPSEVQLLVAQALGEPAAAVTVEMRRMGGGFGGKESQASSWACIAAIAARVTGRPAKIRLDRDDDMIMTGKRHDFRVDFTAGTDADGRLIATTMDQYARCGHSADLSLGICDRAMFHADNAYYLPEVAIRSKRVRTDTVSNTAFRGFGGPQGMVAVERVMDAIAITLGKDPLDVRMANFYGGPGRDVTPYNMTVTDNIMPELVAELEKKTDYRARRAEIDAFNKTSPFLKRGIALTPVKFGISFTLIHLNQAGALVHVYQDGSIHLNHGGTEMGQGLNLKVAQVVAEVFGVSLERVKITAAHTGKVPNTSPTAASSGSDLNGQAARIAAETIRGRLIDFAAKKYGVAPETIVFRDDQVVIGNEVVPFGVLAKQAYVSRVALSSTGFYATPEIHWDRPNATGRPFFYFAYGASCSEVVIDTLTGESRVTRVDILHDAGHSLNPAIDIGQIEGGFVQGMGWLTTEELVFDKAGRLRTHAPSTYKIPCASDVPEHFVTELFESGGARVDTIYRSKAVGEPPLMLPISVFSAITHAVASLKPGTVPPLDAPATAEAILKACQAMTA